MSFTVRKEWPIDSMTFIHEQQIYQNTPNHSNMGQRPFLLHMFFFTFCLLAFFLKICILFYNCFITVNKVEVPPPPELCKVDKVLQTSLVVEKSAAAAMHCRNVWFWLMAVSEGWMFWQKVMAASDICQWQKQSIAESDGCIFLCTTSCLRLLASNL